MSFFKFQTDEAVSTFHELAFPKTCEFSCYIMNQRRIRSIKKPMWMGYIYNVISYVGIEVEKIETVDQSICKDDCKDAIE